MLEVTISLPDYSTEVLTDHPADELRLLAAIKLYEMGRLSSGGAARLAGLERVTFLERLPASGGVTVTLTVDDIARDIAVAAAACR